MRADPEPDHMLTAFDTYGSPAEADSDGIDRFSFMNLLKM
jgi:hypothetical protein